MTTKTQEEVIALIQGRHDGLKGHTHVNDIVKTLERNNVKGQVRCPDACVITNYLLLDVNQDDLDAAQIIVRTGPYQSTIYQKINDEDRITYTLKHTATIKYFIDRFDSYEFPQLVETDTDD